MHRPSSSRPSFAAAASRFLNRARARGVGEASKAAFAALRDRFSSEVAIEFFERSTDPSEPSEAEIRPATAEDAPSYARDIGTDSASTFRARLDGSTQCWVIEENGRLLHATWVTTSKAWTSELGLFFCPPPGSAYLYESYTRPDARGRGLYTAMLRGLARRLAERGLATLWIGVPTDNTPSLRAVAKAGFRTRFTVRSRRRAFKNELELPDGAGDVLKQDC